MAYPVIEVAVTESEIIVKSVDACDGRTLLEGSEASTLPEVIPVPGKPVLVRSLFDLEGRFIDVRGLPSGTEVSDPDTARVFVTP